MKKKTISVTALLTGIFLALAIVLTNLFQIQVNSFSKKEVKTTQQEKKSSQEKTFITLSSFSIPSTTVHVHINIDSCCLFEISFDEQPQQTLHSELQLKSYTFFRTLFRVIISPNAP
jgi:hypothetical protein